MPPSIVLRSSQLVANLDALRAHTSPAEPMLVVKDDAYGLGAQWAAETAMHAGVSWIGTYDVGTALALRETLGTVPRLFAWATSADDEVAQAIRADIDLGVGSMDYLERVIAAAERLGRSVRVHLKVDTGLHRNGIAPAEWAEAVRRTLGAERVGSVRLVGVWSHLAEASDAEDDAAQALFHIAVREAEELGARLEHTHLTASAATWERPELRGSLVRVGAFCYGVRSADGPEIAELAPVASLTAPVVAIDGDEVTVGIGSLDGLPSSLSGRVTVGTPAGARALLSIGLTSTRIASWTGAAIGDEVVLFGPGRVGESSPTTLAETIGTVGEEILTRLAPGIQRRATDEIVDRA